MAKQVVPNAEKGRQAIVRIAKLVCGILLAVAVAAVGAVCAVGGGVAALLGASATVLTAGTVMTGVGAAALLACAYGMRFTAKRNEPHIEEWSRQDELKKLMQGNNDNDPAFAAKPAAKDFNAEAAVRLGNDVKAMRPLKLNIQPPPQTINT